MEIIADACRQRMKITGGKRPCWLEHTKASLWLQRRRIPAATTGRIRLGSVSRDRRAALPGCTCGRLFRSSTPLPNAKRFTGMTPTEYRVLHGRSSSAAPPRRSLLNNGALVEYGVRYKTMPALLCKPTILLCNPTITKRPKLSRVVQV